MMERKPELSYWWATLIGLLFSVLQIVIYYVRFGQLNPYAPLTDYLLFFLAGILGGLALIAFLRRSGTMAAKWSVTLAFLLGTPLAFLGSLGGGLLGSVGAVLFPVLVWTMFSLIGYWGGRLFSKRENSEE